MEQGLLRKDEAEETRCIEGKARFPFQESQLFSRCESEVSVVLLSVEVSLPRYETAVKKGR